MFNGEWDIGNDSNFVIFDNIGEFVIIFDGERNIGNDGNLVILNTRSQRELGYINIKYRIRRYRASSIRRVINGNKRNIIVIINFVIIYVELFIVYVFYIDLLYNLFLSKAEYKNRF